MRTSQSFPFSDLKKIKTQLLQWAQQFDEVVWLDSNTYPQQTYANYEAILAVDAFTSICTDEVNAFEKLNEYQQHTKDWIFGYLTYDLKNDIEHLISQNNDTLGFNDLIFFQPKKVICLTKKTITFNYLSFIDDELNYDYNEISLLKPSFPQNSTHKITIENRLTKEQYTKCVGIMLKHIAKGDIYEANFCQEFYAKNTIIDPLHIYNKLNTISNAPFATFLKWNDKYALCASPERYLKKQGSTLISQPIKGTSKRDSNPKKDILFAKELHENIKERAENIMIVDLVRNDLSKTAVKGSVHVEELCKIYSFDQVHQMISTVKSELSYNYAPVDALQTTFPMGSMTGAPKISAMQIIENLEVTKRGLYSGCIGYFTPDNDFDFNVVIRTILYNASNKYLSFSVGSAITAKSNINAEYNECLLKAKAMRKVLKS